MKFVAVQWTRKKTLWSLVLLASFLVPVVLTLASGDILQPRVVFFPRAGAEDQLSGEVRALPVRDSLSWNIAEVVKAQIQGPLSFEYIPLFDEPAGIKALYLDGKSLHIDFDQGTIPTHPMNHRSMALNMHTIESTLRFNFPAIENISFYIEGQALANWPHVDK